MRKQVIEQDIRNALLALPAVRTKVGLGGSGENYVLALSSDDPQALAAAARAVEHDLRTIPGLGNIASRAALLRPEVAVRTDFARAADLGVTTAAIGGTLRDFQVVSTSDVAITLGRYDGATLGFSGPGSGTAVPGSIHFIMAPSGYPLYLTDVLTGTATYSLLAATSPTNQNNTAGSLGSARLDVNFSNRSLNLNANVSMPAASGNGGGQWQLTAENVPIALNSFFGSTNDRLTITNNLGVSSRTNSNLAGSFEGSFVGTGLGGDA